MSSSAMLFLTFFRLAKRDSSFARANSFLTRALSSRMASKVDRAFRSSPQSAHHLSNNSYFLNPRLASLNILFLSTSARRDRKTFSQNQRRQKKKGGKPSATVDEEDDDNDDDTDDDVYGGQSFVQLRGHFSNLASEEGHQVFVVQPDFRVPEEVVKRGGTVPTVPIVHLRDEAMALIDSFRLWSPVGAMFVDVFKIFTGSFLAKGLVHQVAARIEEDPSEISAVFLNVERLSFRQRVFLEAEWRLPVFDRYTLVLKIFRERARTREAKLQVAKAEIPYMRSQLHEFSRSLRDHPSAHKGSRQGYSMMGGAGETALETRKRLLDDRERKLRRELEAVRQRRETMREQRRSMLDIPVVAVVGYTNCGKTSLIKAMTNDERMEPKNHLFATLDVTLHQTTTPSGIRYLLVDTVGFLSQLPAHLVASFSSTLEDALGADLILHLHDVSHPCFDEHKVNVEATLSRLGVTPDRFETDVVEAWNKVDLRPDLETVEEEEEDKGPLKISATSRRGLFRLNMLLERKIVAKKRLLIRRVILGLTDSEVMRWLQREATVLSIAADADTETMVVECLASPAVAAKFSAAFPGRQLRERG